MSARCCVPGCGHRDRSFQTPSNDILRPRWRATDLFTQHFCWCVWFKSIEVQITRGWGWEVVVVVVVVMVVGWWWVGVGWWWGLGVVCGVCVCVCVCVWGGGGGGGGGGGVDLSMRLLLKTWIGVMLWDQRQIIIEILLVVYIEVWEFEYFVRTVTNSMLSNLDFQETRDVVQTYLLHTWASCQIRKIAGCAFAGNVGSVFSATDLKGFR